MSNWQQRSYLTKQIEDDSWLHIIALKNEEFHVVIHDNPSKEIRFEVIMADQVIGTELDPESIMMYAIPANWTLDGFHTEFNKVISAKDIEFISSVYPFPVEDNGEKDIFKKVFTAKKDLSRLNEATIVRVGQLMGLDTNEKRYTKARNCQIVWDFLNS